MSKDPILFTGGINLYEYANNDPVNYIDSNGKNPYLIIGAGALAGAIGNFIGTTIATGSIKAGIESIPAGALAGAAGTATALGVAAGAAITGTAAAIGLFVDTVISIATAPGVLPDGTGQDFGNGLRHLINPQKNVCEP